jgi:hypothetical protein
MRDREIVRLAFALARAVEVLVEHTRRFCYEVMLSAHGCPKCGASLEMIGESRCRCRGCSHELDPTVEFQRCPACDGRLRLRICRYLCRTCGADVRSRFVFDGIVFDREYFRRKMAESRERRQQERVDRRERAAENRSLPVEPSPMDLTSVPGLLEALNELTSIPELAAWAPLIQGFDLERYEAHLEAHMTGYERRFDDLPPLDENPRLDRIWRFIAVIFMAHAGRIRIRQQGPIILVVRSNGTDAEGP